MLDAASLVGRWTAEKRILVFHDDGTFTFELPAHWAERGTYRLATEVPYRRSAWMYPASMSGLLLVLDFERPPDILPYSECWLLDIVSPGRIVIRYPTQMIPDEFLIPVEFREIKLTRLPKEAVFQPRSGLPDPTFGR